MSYQVIMSLLALRIGPGTLAYAYDDDDYESI